MPVSSICDNLQYSDKYKSFLKLKCKFGNTKLIKMPYEEVCFQRLEEDNPEDYAKLKPKKSA